MGLFTRRAPARAVPVAGPKRPGRGAPTGYHAETILVANPDTRAIARLRVLNQRIGLGLQGHTGTPYGYDRGDPARSLTGPVPTAGASITAAQARIVSPHANSVRPTMNYSDVPLTSPELDPYNALLFNRMVQP